MNVETVIAIVTAGIAFVTSVATFTYNFIQNRKNRIQKVIALRESFADKYLKYDWAYWKYIQSQKEGNYMDSDEAFDNVYYEFVNGLDRAS